MKKKITLIILVCLVALLAVTFVACNKSGSELVSSAPEEIGPGITDEEEQQQEVDGGYAILSFQFVDEMSSLFHSITIDEETGFDIESVNYIVSFTKGGTTTVSSPKPIKEDYLDADSLALLHKKGHHTIHVSIPYGNSVLKGSFSLHLRYAYEEVEYVTLKFNLEGGIPRFASYSEDVATIKVEKDLFFTYDEFFRNFTVTKANSAIDYFDVDGNSVKKLQRVPSKDASDSITITGDTTFKCVWTTNTITVKFSISKPSKDAKLAPDAETPKVEDQSVQQSVGVIQRPLEDLNAYNGYYFSGWYTAPQGNSSARVWNFTNPVGQDDIILYAHWSVKYYSITIYPMGGNFKSDLATAKSTKGYTEATCAVVNNASSTMPASIEIGGLTYGKSYSNYYVNISIGGETKTVLLQDLFTAFYKPVTENVLVGKISSDASLYTSQTCATNTAVTPSDAITTSTSLYVKWKFDIKKTDENYDNIISAFYTDVLFKNSYYIKADGSIVLYDIQDETFNEIVVPDYIIINGVKRYISEIGDKGVMNVRSLGKLDLSDAVHLTTIGKEAFINCKNLSTIEWPTKNNITTVGYNAFSNTAWEDTKIENAKAKENPSDPYIVVNKILYKYIDLSTLDSKITTINMNNHAETLQGVTVIAERAFKDSIYLKEITLLNSIVEIKNYAFMNSDQLVKVSAGSNLQIVRAAAFEGTLLYDATESKNIKKMKDASGNDVNVVVVGNVLDDVLDKTITSFVFRSEDGITAISEEAFETCDLLEEIKFESAAEAKISYIGANAFATPVEFLRTLEGGKEGFLIVNNVLAEYYNSNYYYYDVVIPKEVSRIGAQSFGGYARYLKTIQIGEAVSYIDEYAFLGATQLKSLLFSSVQYNGLENKIYKLPEFNPLAFSNEDGGLINDINFYFYSGVLQYFKDLADEKATTTDSNVLAWLELYKKNKDHFIEEKIEKIYVNTDVVPSLYVISGNTGWGTYPNGLILKSSADVIKYEEFNSSTLNEAFLHENEGTYTATIKENSKYTGAKYSDFTYTIKHNVKSSTKFNGGPSFYNPKDSNTIIDGDSLDFAKDNFQVIGFTGIDKTTEGYPVFYTTQTSIDIENIKLKYLTWASNEETIKAIDYSDFSPNSNRIKTITFTFELCNGYKYKIKMSYKGVEPKVQSIQQAEPISVPLNANVTSAFGKSWISYYGEDGIVTNEYLDMSEYDIVKVNGGESDLTLYSNALGLNTVELKYKGSKKVSNKLGNLTIVYAVVLDGDATQFTFDKKGNGWIITGHNNKNVETLVIPSSYTTANGVTLDVIEISDNVFSGYTNMTTLYLPSTIKKIGAGAFKNCTVLRNIYSSESMKNEKTNISDSSFKVLSKSVYENGTIEISAMDMASGTVVIPDYVTYSTTETKGGIEVKTTVSAVPVLTDKLFDTFTGTLYLDYSEANLEYVKKYLIDKNENTANGIVVVFMFNDIDTVNELNKNEKLQFYLHNEANIAQVESLKNPEDDGKAIDMPVNYLFYYVVSATEARKTSTQQRHFTLNTTSGLTIESRTIEQTRELFTLNSGIASGLESIIVGDLYESFAYVDGTFKGTRYSYDEEKKQYVVDSKYGTYQQLTHYAYEPISEEEDATFKGTKYAYDSENEKYVDCIKLGKYKQVNKYAYELIPESEKATYTGTKYAYDEANKKYVEDTNGTFKQVKVYEYVLISESEKATYTDTKYKYDEANKKYVEDVNGTYKKVEAYEYEPISEEENATFKGTRYAYDTVNKKYVEYKELGIYKQVEVYKYVELSEEEKTTYTGTKYAYDYENEKYVDCKELGKYKQVNKYAYELIPESEKTTYTGTKYKYDSENEKYVEDANGTYKKVEAYEYELISEEEKATYTGTKYAYDAINKKYVVYSELGKFKKILSTYFEKLTLEERGVAQRTLNSTTSIDSNLKYDGTEFVVYLPDTIFNTCVIKNSSNVSQTIIIYKHGEELLYSTKNAIPEAIEFIGNGAFENCIALKSINLSSATKLSYIGTNAFAKSGLESIDLSNTNVAEINSQTFKDCASLTSVKLSSKMNFTGTRYSYDEANKKYVEDVNGTFKQVYELISESEMGSYTGKKYKYDEANKKYVEDSKGTFKQAYELIPGMFIGSYAFDGCTSLVLDANFFANISTIQAYAFNKCTALTSVDLTKAKLLTKIGSQAFSNDETTIEVAKNANMTNWASDWYGFCTVQTEA